MRVIYQTSMLDRIADIKSKATRENRKIEVLVLTKEEFTRLEQEAGTSFLYRVHHPSPSRPPQVLGIPISVESI